MPSRKIDQALRARINRHTTGSLPLLLSFLACSGGCGDTARNSLPNVAINQQPNTSTAVTQSSTSSVVPVHLTYFLASKYVKTSSRHLQYISASNTKIIITVTPVGSVTPTYGPTTTGCTPGSCAITFTANPGLNTISFILTNGTQTLSTFNTTAFVNQNGLNTLNFSANPVVYNVALQHSGISTLAIPAGVAATNSLTVVATDFNSNTIIGTSNYVDMNGNPLTFNLSVINSQSGGSGIVTLSGPTSITAPGGATINANYNGKWLDHSTISVTPSGPIGGTITSLKLTATPTIYEYTASGTATSPLGIVTGPDGNLWYTEYDGNKVVRMTTQNVQTPFGCGACGQLNYITKGPDGALWFNSAAAADDAIYRITTSGTPSLVALAGTDPTDIKFGPDGQAWYTLDNQSDIGSITPSGTNNTMATSGITRSINIGPNGTMWFTDVGANKIGVVSPNGTITEHAVTNVGSSNTASDGIVLGPDGNVWFTEYPGNLIGRMTPTFGLTEYTAPSGGPRRIIVGPDSNLWFTEQSGNKIATINTSGVITVTEYGTTSGLTAASGPCDLTIGPDGNIWFTQFSTNQIGEFVL